jgi:hypothetical protein
MMWNCKEMIGVLIRIIVVLINMLYFINNYNNHDKIFTGNHVCGMATAVYWRERTRPTSV